MPLRFSTGLRNALLDTGSFRGQMSSKVVKIYGNASPPSNADAAVTGTLICTTNAITWETSASNGTIRKSDDVVSGTNVIDGTATYFRICDATDTGASDPSKLRIQGTVGIAGSDMIVNSTMFSQGARTVVNTIEISIPAVASS